MEEAKLENLDQVLAYARSLPNFPMKSVVLQRLETGNLNRYQEALLTLNEVIVEYEEPSDDSITPAVTREQLQVLIDKIASMEAKDQVAE